MGTDLQLLELLSEIMLLNKDDGRKFTITDRLDKINALLWNSRYRRLNAQGLFHLFGTSTIENIDKSIILVSSHIDCESGIRSCFTRDEGAELIRGTYDNCITNTAILYLMLEGLLPDNVTIAFTGDEERDSRGAKQVCNYFNDKKRDIYFAIVLDVTDMGWKEQADFTIENNFWDEHLGTKVIKAAEEAQNNWYLVPEDPKSIPIYVKKANVIPVEAECDESWLYDEMDKQCFSVCLPIKGLIHSDKGVLARKESFIKYTEFLRLLLQKLANIC